MLQVRTVQLSLNLQIIIMIPFKPHGSIAKFLKKKGFVFACLFNSHACYA